MDARYAETVRAASGIIQAAVVDRDGEALMGDVRGLDALVRDILREVGHAIVEGTFGALSSRLVTAKREPGMTIESSPTIEVGTVYGWVNVPSPYLRDRERKGTTLRPVSSVWGLHHRSRTPAVERALTDFGAEESFGHASKCFQEHYGFAMERTTILRIVEGHAKRAEIYVEQRLAEAKKSFDEPQASRPGTEQMLVELDGCEIRTGVLKPAPTQEPCAVRPIDKRVREQAWRDVRVGLARVPDQITPTYVARLDSYPIVVGQLFAAACERGLSSRTKVFAVGDGGNGLAEEIAAQFAGARYVLDRPHAKHHLYETADAIGLKGTEREQWVTKHVDRLHSGEVEPVLAELRAHKGRGKARVERLLAYFTRFREGFHYDAIKEQGLPIGSGAIESAHRIIPQKRLKLPGTWWHPDTINPMLALRVLRANEWWDNFWKQAA